MPTLADLVVEVQGHLNQYTVNRERTGTLVSMTPTSVQLADLGGDVARTLVELETGELIHVTRHDPSNNTTSVPPWFRGQLGTPTAVLPTVNSRVLVEPVWPKYHVAKKICEAVTHLYPRLFAVKEYETTTSATNGNYELPADTQGILSIRVEELGAGREQYSLWRWSFDASNPDGKKYLRTQPTNPSRPLYITYKAKPVALDPADLSADWADTGLAPSHARCAVLYAAHALLPAYDTSRLQTHSSEQSDRSRFIQSGSALSAARFYRDMFLDAVEQERGALLELYPPRPHRELS